MKKYGKFNLEVIELKRSFVTQNASWKVDQEAINKIYRAQPKRQDCKNCLQAVDQPAFTKEDIDYFVCDRCGHLSGGHEETTEFCEEAYQGDSEKRYASKYKSEDAAAFHERAQKIYAPKAEFVISALAEHCSNAHDLKFADLGAGSGYMVSALLSQGVSNAQGYEVSSAQVEFGNAMLGQERLISQGLIDIAEVAATVNADVVTLIGTLEHFKEPRDVLAALAKNRNVSYVFFSVPLFSATVFFDLMFPKALQSQLGGRHTHLYTEESIDWFCDEYGFERAAEWWFGSDMIHLFRHLRVQMERDMQPEVSNKLLSDRIVSSLDAMQLAMDEKHLSSEVHMLLKKTSPQGTRN